MTPGLTPASIEIEYRVLWVEHPGGVRVPFTGKVGDFERALAEYRLKADTYGYHDVLIEARLKLDAEWPHPEDRRGGWRL